MADRFRRLRGCMTVADARHALADMPDEALLVLAADYGDRSHTIQLLPVEVIRPVSRDQVAETGYSASRLCLRHGEDEDGGEATLADDDEADTHLVVLGAESDVY